MKENRLYKSERLCRKKDFDHLFEQTESIFVYPFKIVYKAVEFEEKEEFKIGISVSKKSFKRAVKRNRIKRLVRESVRQNKQMLKQFLAQEKIGVRMLFIYISKDMPEYANVEPKIKTIFEKITKVLKEPANMDSSGTN